MMFDDVFVASLTTTSKRSQIIFYVDMTDTLITIVYTIKKG